jgi:hypothetical protein
LFDRPGAQSFLQALVVAIDPGKAKHRVLLADGERALIEEPVSLSTQREGIERLCEMIARAGGGGLAPVDSAVVQSEQKAVLVMIGNSYHDKNAGGPDRDFRCPSP